MKKTTRAQVWAYVADNNLKCYLTSTGIVVYGFRYCHELEDAFNALGGVEDYDYNKLEIKL